ncbi:MAG: hypothetical protein AVDCRST_MAG86-2097 [uncultured Truepera sp.]|uniref:Abnormal spindle-like microcephaly-associated protein ASH domain-containing protein n=1 Tax=uncultured Truepera sp. TaxID=543023 RepID=A0A6J4VEN1_9DEIN|nr:MAG: hypothetical protein AVDCRST_MAG86-2097 [uncultured Truepera sp.]
MKKSLLIALSAVLAGCAETTRPGEDSGGPPVGTLTLSRSEMVFNAGGDVPSDRRTLQVSNTGEGTLNVSGLAVTGEDAARFALPGVSPFSLAAGESRELAVTFTPNSDADLGPQNATLRVTQGGEGGSVQEVYLGGLSVEGQEGTKEPSVQWIFDTYGFPIQTGDEDPTTSALVEEATNAPVGDEVVAQTFRRADPTQPVTVEVLATFAVPNVEPVFEFGFYEAGAAEPSLQKLLSLPIRPGLNGQRLGPVIVPSVPGAEAGVVSFNAPGGTFGFYSSWPTTRFFEQRTVFTEDARNTFDALPHHVRPYPLKERGGAPVENAYILATDESNRLNDYNDAVVLIRNVQPAEAGL